MRQTFLTVTSLPLVFAAACAQTVPPAPQYKFEVATIKPSNDPSPNVRIGPGPNGGIRTQNTTALQLLTFAYDVRDFQIVGAPGWVKSDRFDVTGTPDKPEAAPSPSMKRADLEQMFDRQRQRMQALLLDRFGLTLHSETREMPIYSLSVSKGGPKLESAAEGPTNMRMQRGHIFAAGANMRMFANSLSGILGRPVVDETGLSGAYSFEIEWTPETVSADGAPGDIGPSIFTAIREKLGLRLDAKKGPAPVLVIDKIEKPGAN